MVRLHQARLAVGDRTLSEHVLTLNAERRGSRVLARTSPDTTGTSSYQRTRKTSCTILAWLSPRSCVRRKLSALEPTVELLVNVPLFATGPWLPLGKNVCVNPSGVPAVDAGLKYGELNAFSISARNSNVTGPWIFTRFDAPMSKRTSGG